MSLFYVLPVELYSRKPANHLGQQDTTMLYESIDCSACCFYHNASSSFNFARHLSFFSSCCAVVVTGAATRVRGRSGAKESPHIGNIVLCLCKIALHLQLAKSIR